MIERKISRIRLQWMRKYIRFLCIILLAICPGTALAASPNIIINPGFESGNTSWMFYTNGVGNFSIISPGFEGNNSAELAFSSGGTNIQLYQNGITLEANTRYRLNFRAYSNTGHDVRVNLMGIPYAPYGLAYTADLGTSWQTFTTEFTTIGFSNTVDNGRLQFWFVDFASEGDTYYIDDIRLEQASLAELPTIITYPSNQMVTAGQTATFSVVATGTAPLTYQWQYQRKNNFVDLPGATSSSFTTPAAALSNNGAVVRVIVSDSEGSATSNPATLTVTISPVPPGIATQPSSQTVNEGQTATFSVAATGTAPLAYQWQYQRKDNFVDLPGATSSSFTTPAAALSNNGAVVRVIVSDSEGSATSNPATLTVTISPIPPSITTQPSSQTVNEGQTATFSVAATGTAPLTYQWQYQRKDNFVDLPGATSSSFTTPAAALSNNGAVVRVIVSNSEGNATSNPATLTVTISPTLPSITTQPSSQTVNEGQTATFSVAATGTEPLAYQWQYQRKDNFIDLPGATSSSFTTPAAALSNNGAVVRVIVSDSEGSTTSNPATLTVTISPTLPSITTQPSSQTVNEGQTATFSVAATGTAPLAYQWQYQRKDNFVDLPGETSSSFTTPAAALSNNGAVVRVIVSDSEGSTTSNPATLTVTISPIPPSITTQPSSQTVNEGQTATFSVAATGTAPLAYQWQYRRKDNFVDLPGATSSSFTTPAAALSNNGAVVRVIVSDSEGSATSNPATLTVISSTPTPNNTTQLSLHPDNNHYFIYKDKPTILIGSNEHYGAVLNLDFDYDIYLNELQSKGLNYVRVFSGTYIEPNPNMGSWWDIDDNTLAPTNNGFISPWARSTTKGFAGDSNSYKFDLSQWDTEYFDRLRDFVRKADSKGIVVEYVFFCPFWSMNDQTTPLPNMWARSPLNIMNNINNVGATASWNNDGYDMVWDVRAENYNDGLTPYMGNMVTKVVQELNEFDNVIFQPGIETYKGDGNGGNSDPAVTMETIFEDYIISKIVAADTPKKHLISQNRDAAWGTTKNIKSEVSVLSWDAGSNTAMASTFYNLNKPLSNDEFAYGGRGEVQYRRVGWKWIIAGGAIFNMLDLSFTPYRGEEAGTKIMPYTTSTGGTRLLGGSAALRTQLGILNDFIHSFNFVKMAPDNSILTEGAPSGTRALVEMGKQYAIYLPEGTSANLSINLPAGNYNVDWVNTKTGNIDKTEDIVGHTGGNIILLSPDYSEDIALRILNTS